MVYNDYDDSDHDGQFYVYIIECNDGSFYTGQTKDIDRRMNEHHNGAGARYTKYRRPITLRRVEEYDTRDEALEREEQIKNLSHDAKAELVELD